MKRMMIILAVWTLGGCAVVTPADAPPKVVSNEDRAALDLVNRRIAAYNAHDIEAFLATYDENVRIYVYPERLLGEGRARMRGIFAPQFAKAEGSIVVRGQHVLQNRVVSDEDITIGDRNDRNIAIYTIANNLISEVRLIEKDR